MYRESEKEPKKRQAKKKTGTAANSTHYPARTRTQWRHPTADDNRRQGRVGVGKDGGQPAVQRCQKSMAMAGEDRARRGSNARAASRRLGRCRRGGRRRVGLAFGAIGVGHGPVCRVPLVGGLALGVGSGGGSAWRVLVISCGRTEVTPTSNHIQAHVAEEHQRDKRNGRSVNGKGWSGAARERRWKGNVSTAVHAHLDTTTKV